MELISSFFNAPGVGAVFKVQVPSFVPILNPILNLGREGRRSGQLNAGCLQRRGFMEAGGKLPAWGSILYKTMYLSLDYVEMGFVSVLEDELPVKGVDIVFRGSYGRRIEVEILSE